MDASLVRGFLVCFLSFACLCVRPCVSQNDANGNSFGSVQNYSPTVVEVRPSPEVPSTRACPPGSCPPQWIGLLNQYRNLLNDRVMQPVCKSALHNGFVGHCDMPQQTCGNNNNMHGANFCCCPAVYLSKVQMCLPMSRYICIPDTFGPWQQQLQRLIMTMFAG